MTAHQNDLLRTEALGRDDAAEPNSAVADDSGRFTRCHTRDMCRMVPGAHHIRKCQERRHKRVISANRQSEQRAVGLRNTKGFRLRPLHAAIAEKATMEASGLQMLVTEDTGAIGERERHDNEVALLHGSNLSTGLFDNPDCFVAHALSPVLGLRPKVASADTGTRDPYDGVTRSLIWESGTFSTRTSPAPYMTVARIWTRSFQVSLEPLNFSAAILVVRNMLHPINGLAVELFLDGDVAHGRRRRSAVPVLLTWREPDDIAGPDLLDRAAFTLHPAETGHDEQGLAKRMRVPGRACARFKSD